MTRGRAAFLVVLAFVAGYCIAWRPSMWRGSGVAALTVEVSRGFRAIEQRLLTIESQLGALERCQ